MPSLLGCFAGVIHLAMFSDSEGRFRVVLGSQGVILGDSGSYQVAGAVLGRSGGPWGLRTLGNLGKPWENLGKPLENLGKPQGFFGTPLENLGKPKKNIGEPSKTLESQWKT